MASSSSFNNNIPLSVTLEWYKIRDTFFGHNYVSQNIRLAIELAGSCQHPDAIWLTEVCAGEDVTTVEDVKRVFAARHDRRALCFLGVFGDDNGVLERSAELGYAFSQAMMAGKTLGEEKRKFAELAAAQGERDGFYWLGRCYRGQDGNVKAKEAFLQASRQNDVFSMVDLGRLLSESDPQRWYWLGVAARNQSNAYFLSSFAGQVEAFNSGCGSASVMYAIGRALAGHVGVESIFNGDWNFEEWIRPANQAVAFYEFQKVSCRKAVDSWTLVGRRFNVVKDVRKFIAKLIWDTREEALFRQN